ncbi:MAG TPA: ABC transporter permease [Vicinamibacterales bacterium]|nr:ABC transporter permease [Vicinamibacterales bacterium]
MTTLLQDLRFGARLLRRQPGFTFVAVLVLTVGIGATTAAFSFVNALMLKPRTGGIDQELLGVYSRHRERRDDYRAFGWADYTWLRDRRDLFQSLTAHGFGLVGLKEGEVTRRVFADIVSANYFETFGVTLPLGRTFTAEEERPGADIPVLVLSHGAWMRLGGTPDIIGRQVRVNLRAFTVVGVAPQGFGGSMVLATPEIWVPTGMYETMAFDIRNEGRKVSLADPEFRELILVGRLRPGATIESLGGPLAAASRMMTDENPAANKDHELQLAQLSRLSVSTRPQVDDELTGVAAMLLSLAAVVLFIASFNLANMLLARGQGRRKEFAIRLAIGGGRLRLVRQLLTESVLLALIGGVGGVLLSWWTTRYVFATMPPILPISLAFDSTPDIRVLASTVAFSLLAAVVFGLGPALKLARADAMPELKDLGGELVARRTSWLRWLTTRDLLVMGQLALTFLMLTAAGLFVRGALEAARSDPGFTLDRGLIVNVDTSFGGYDSERSRTYYREALETLRRTPGVAAAGFASHMPFGEFQFSTGVQLPGPQITGDDPSGLLVDATVVSISSRYFDAMGIPILRGRDFTDGESFFAGGEPLAIIDETLARRLFENEDPVGRQVQRSRNGVPVVLRVVGVVRGVRPDLFSNGPEPFIYLPFGQQFQANIYLHARTGAPTAAAETALLPAVGRALTALDPALPFVSLETRPMFRERNLLLALVQTGAWVFASFGAGALFLAVAGVYGVKSYLVSRRTREIGIRIALGAEPHKVVGMVVGEGLMLVVVGLVAGVGLSLITGMLVRGVFFQGRALDVPVIALSATTLTLAIVTASWLPARRATRVDPAAALRVQ